MQASEIVRSIKLDEIIRAEGSTCLAEFAETLERSPDANLDSFLSTRPKQDRDQLPALIGIELRHCWERGKPCFIESYFERFPELLKDREQVLDLIYAEYCERRQQATSFDSAEYYERFPDLQNSLERLFQIDSLFAGAPELIEQAAETTRKLPDAGDEFLDFRLLAELGRGTFGRVFLAEQTSLSDRRVVVKITPLRTIEHQTLARLNHPNIVPVHSVHRDDLSGLQAVCMPYQCAVALSDVHTTWRATGLIPTEASAFAHALENLVPADLRKSEEQNGVSRFPMRQSYVVACAWIMQRLAAALHHAHLRGIYHRDLKPSNILLTAGGQPLLVDFNLAFNNEETGGDSLAFFGGTLPYMPPEQIQVLHPAEQGRADDVGPRSDIYSLAATVFELLTGRLPYDPPQRGEERLVALRGQLERRFAKVPSARSLNPRVPQDLDALLIKCLDPASYQRYETAAHLSDDLQRFLDDRPLHQIGPVPKRQVILKFLRRNRRRFAAGIGTVAACALIAGGVHLSTVRLERRNAADEVAAKVQDLAARTNDDMLPAQVFRLGWEYSQQNRYRHAIDAFTRAVELGYANQPAGYQVYYYRGMCHASLDEDQAARDDYSNAIRLKADYGHAYLNRALLYASTHSRALKDLRKAQDDLENALRFAPADESTTAASYFHDVAKIYTAIAYADPKNPIEDTCEKAETYLMKAVKLGYSPELIQQRLRLDRYKLLKPLLDRRNLREFMAQHEATDNQASQ